MKQCALREREKIKALGLVGPIGKCVSTLMVHLDLVGLWVASWWPLLPPELHSVGLLSEPPNMNNYLFNFHIQKSMHAFLICSYFIPHGEL